MKMDIVRATREFEAWLGSQTPIIVADLSRRIVRSNQHYLDMFGFTRDELVRGGVDLVLEVLLPQLEDADALAAKSRAIWQHPDRELRVTGDRGQRIVQIVGDAARQPADSLHFLGMAQLIFELPVIRDVLDRADHANGLSVVAAENVGALVNPAFRAVTADYPMLDVVHRPALDRGQTRPDLWSSAVDLESPPHRRAGVGPA